MSILNFQKPDKITLQKNTESEAIFEFRPLEPGFGVTIGNALRRVLLSSLEGHAITGFKMNGVDHEFATVPGVLEDVTEIILNLKQVRLKKLEQESEQISDKVEVNIKGKEQFTASMIGDALPAYQILNPELVIFNMEPTLNLSIELHIGKGRGYVPSEENRTTDGTIGVIAIDSIYTPIKNVKYTIENTRVEQWDGL